MLSKYLAPESVIYMSESRETSASRGHGLSVKNYDGVCLEENIIEGRVQFDNCTDVALQNNVILNGEVIADNSEVACTSP